MKSGIISKSAKLLVIIAMFAGAVLVSCSGSRTALETIKPVREYFVTLQEGEVFGPDLSGIDGTNGEILTWRVKEDARGGEVEYSWVLAKNTDDLKKALIVFDSVRAWNTESYVFLPVTNAALEVHERVGLMVPESIYDEDGMNRIREIVMSGEVPEGSFVDQFEQFYE